MIETMKVHEVPAGRKFKVYRSSGWNNSDPIYLRLEGSIENECNVVNCNNWLWQSLQDDIMVELLPVSSQTICNTLSRQDFADWYNTGEFNNWISGELPKVKDEKVLDSIRKMFRNLI